MDRKQMCRDFGRRVRSAREDRHLTREDLAQATHLAVSTLARVERGERLPQATTIIMLAKALEIPLHELAAMVGLEIRPDATEPWSERRRQLAFQLGEGPGRRD